MEFAQCRLPQAMAPRKSVLAMLVANLLIPLGILIFAIGFFPYKPFLPGKATFNENDVQHAPFDRVIFMVVDALRRSVLPQRYAEM